MPQDLVVVIPGITGSVLRRDGHDVWNLSLSAVGRGLKSFSRTVESLRLPDDIGAGAAPAPAALDVAGLVTGWHLWPGIYGGPGYRRLVGALSQTVPGGVRSFSYDWRLSNRHTARLLAAQVDRWLADWRATTGHPDAKVVFVCHSMGGLVARYYLEVLGGRDQARRLITLGTPYHGSVNAIRALTGDAFRPLRLVGQHAGITSTARSFPALWELLPTYRCIAAPAGLAGAGLAGASLAGQADQAGPIGLRQASLTGLPPHLIASALDFHQEIATAVAGNGPAPYQLHAFAGKRQTTWQSVVLGHGERHYQRLQRGHDHGGDGTVPLFSAIPPEWASTEQAISRAVRHGGLCLDDMVLDLMLDKIEPLDLGDVLAPPCELGLDVPDIAGDQDPIEVRVDSDRQDLLLAVRLMDPETDRLIAEARMRSDGAGGYQASLEPVPGTWRVIVEAVAEHPPVRVEDLITVARIGD